MARCRLLITGVYPDTEAYPNIYHRIRTLQQHESFITTTVHRQGWSSATQSSAGRARLWRNLGTMIWAHSSVFLCSLFRRRPDITYIPYPAVGLLWMLSWFGRRWLRERIVVDAFISLYDTIVLDRELYPVDSPLARVLFSIERRAYRFADLVIVDTAENAAHLADFLSLPREKFFACPLSTDEIVLQPLPYAPPAVSGSQDCRVLFIGTMIPLHGIATIVDAARLLEDEPVQITVIGDGQESETMSVAGANIYWQREWLDSQAIAEAIASADICLGIFGATAKADRVLPYKIYAYSRVGRAVITAATTCLVSITAELDYSPYKTVPAADPVALATAVRELVASPKLRLQFATANARYYREHLSHQALLSNLLQAILGTEEVETD